MSASVAAWSSYSLDHARAAAHFVRQCSKLEAETAIPLDRAITQQVLAEHRSAVTAAIFASAAFLEASINELFSSAGHDNFEVGGGRGGLPQRRRQLLALLSEPLERASTLDRYQLALGLLDHEQLEIGAQPFQDTVLLVKLRNKLVHYRPEWRAGAVDGAASDPDQAGESSRRQRPQAEPVHERSQSILPGPMPGTRLRSMGLGIGVTAVYESIIDEFGTNLPPVVAVVANCPRGV